MRYGDAAITVMLCLPTEMFFLDRILKGDVVRREHGRDYKPTYLVSRATMFPPSSAEKRTSGSIGDQQRAPTRCP